MERLPGYWVMQWSSVVKGIISKCVTYKTLQGKAGEKNNGRFTFS